MTKFLDWLSKEKLYTESNSLRIKIFTIAYLTKLHPCLSNCVQLKPLLNDKLNDITIHHLFASKLDPVLQQLQLNAMANGDVFVSNLPPIKHTSVMTVRKPESPPT